MLAERNGKTKQNKNNSRHPGVIGNIPTVRKTKSTCLKTKTNNPIAMISQENDLGEFKSWNSK